MMARILSPEEFRKCPTGTVFAFGGEWHFGNLLILHDFVGPYENGGWGFYAIDPMWIGVDHSGQASCRLEEMKVSGVSYPCETASTKYMNYDGDQMDLFIVLDRSDWQALRQIVEPAFTSMEASDG